uniref:Uncharacterized protein n=1 Tax=Nelumbo nucifera TaxID=4432 RepID=A0A822ZYK7_NELNU|nr:TPA_asm: hypothetical protein HUJ06_017863 [Nelumbo nucifera]
MAYPLSLLSTMSTQEHNWNSRNTRTKFEFGLGRKVKH